MFSTKRRQSFESISESKNVSAWESLISDLSETRREDDEMASDNDDSDGGKGFLNGADDDTSLSLSGSGNDEEKMEQTSDLPEFLKNIHQDNDAAAASSNGGEEQKRTLLGGQDCPDNKSTLSSIDALSSSQTTSTTLESPSQLKDWMAYRSAQHPPHVNYMGRKMDETYTLKAAQIALSLSKYLGRQFEQEKYAKSSHEDLPSIRCEDIVVDNVIVTNVDSGEAVLESTSSLGGATNHRSGGNTERRQVLALGMILYELFTQGTPPPRQIQESLKSSGSVLSFVTSLRISEKSEEEDGDRKASGGDRRKNKDDDDDNDMKGEADHSAQESFVRKQRRRRCDEKGKEESVPTLLKLAGVPSSICRLISDMLSNRDDADFGGLFQYDKAVSCFAEAIMDLEQMVDEPKGYLHDTIRLSAKPTVLNKLYSRQKELEQGIELARRSAGGYHKEGESRVEYVEACAMDTSSSVEQEVLVISGLPGSGKSSLVNELIVQLKSNGWESLHCKFDQIGRRQPLSTIASAFDSLFSSLLSTENTLGSGGSGTLGDMRTNLLKSFDEESFPILFHLMPNLRRVVSTDGNSTDMQQTEYVFDEFALISSKIRVHNLFYELLKAISSSWNAPILLFLDDLHWADSASLELISFLIEEMGASIADDPIRGANVFIVGTVRTNEVDNSSDLADFLQQMRSCYNVTVTDMALQDLSTDDVNVMISEALFYSQRLTRSLAGTVHQKTEGNPFYIKEFLNDLTVENLLVYSFSEKTWEWDEELIESRTISDGVAELLTRKLLRLSKDQLSGIVMLSCFGSEVSLEVLALVRSSGGNSDIMNTLDYLAKVRLVERSDEKYCFVHDMILHAAQGAVDENERMIIMKELLQALLPHGYSDDTILFIVVDLISRVGADRVHDSETRLLFAQLLLTAAKKATNTTDFASASTCVKCGVSFLSVGHWEDSYRLSLELFSQSALVEWALGNTEQMMRSLDEVFNNANRFEDTLRAARVKLAYLRMTGNCLAEAFDYGFQVLEQLGESFPATPKNGIIVQEMLGTKQLVTGSMNESKLKSLPEMTDSTKKEAMAFLEQMLICSYQSQSIYFPLIACRMVRISVQFGWTKTSCVGLASLALSLVTVFSDFSEGYSLAKTSISIAGSDKRVLCSIMTITYGMINIWKEPIQAILPQLKDVYNMSLKYGLIDTALSSGMFHAYRAFFTGSLLQPFSKEVALFMRNNSERHKRRLMHLSVLSLSNGISCLRGNSSGPQYVEEFITEEHLAEALRNKEFAACEVMFAIKMMCSFIFRRPDGIKPIARQYLELFERHGSASAQFVNIYRLFYGGLLSLHYYRESRDQFWLDRAAHAIQKMEVWTAESVWNFENKLLLLQAERHYAFGEMDLAAEKYMLAQESSKKHRFIHEEALACELAAAFHEKTGNVLFVVELIDRAVNCYQTWGAEGKVESLPLER
ncbi:putative AAA ATPase [Skeletonema marinoi]|uniref:AAA ATPase n=1 Tax=Skeletonema marinoi TaxID=267567 RepID=A0AAD8Y0R7_9STRA|nr:putative AAA ATPase [Skeletonema marinoi]